MKRILVVFFVLGIASMACSLTEDDNTDIQVQISIGLTQTALAKMQTELAATQAMDGQEVVGPTVPPVPTATFTVEPPSQQRRRVL